MSLRTFLSWQCSTFSPWCYISCVHVSVYSSILTLNLLYIRTIMNLISIFKIRTLLLHITYNGPFVTSGIDHTGFLSRKDVFIQYVHVKRLITIIINIPKITQLLNYTCLHLLSKCYCIMLCHMSSHQLTFPGMNN